MQKLFKKHLSTKDKNKATNKDKKDKDKSTKKDKKNQDSRRTFLAVTLHHRDEFSLGDNRYILGREAYHWGILLMPEAPEEDRCAAFDVSDGAMPDPNTWQDMNPDRDWHFRAKRPVNPVMSGHLLGRVIVGQVNDATSAADLDELLRLVPLPMKGANPPGSCVTWTMAALLAMQSAGIVYPFDLEKFFDWALLYGDSCLANPGPQNIYDYSEVMLAQSGL